MNNKVYSEKLSRLLSFKPRKTLDKLKEFKMSQSARSQYLAKVKADQAKADSFKEAMDMAQAVIDAREEENNVSKTPGLGRMDVFKAYVKRTVKKIKRAVKGFVMFRRAKKIKANIQAGVQNHFQTYKTVYIAVLMSVAVSLLVGGLVGYNRGLSVGGHEGTQAGVQGVANLAYLEDVDLFDRIRALINSAATDRLTFGDTAKAASAKAAEIKAAA